MTETDAEHDGWDSIEVDELHEGDMVRLRFDDRQTAPIATIHRIKPCVAGLDGRSNSRDLIVTYETGDAESLCEYDRNFPTRIKLINRLPNNTWTLDDLTARLFEVYVEQNEGITEEDRIYDPREAAIVELLELALKGIYCANDNRSLSDQAIDGQTTTASQPDLIEVDMEYDQSSDDGQVLEPLIN